MPTRKQRRRAQKERRHEYETVWVDAEGNELDEPPEELCRGAREATNGTKPKQAKATPAARRSRRSRVPPPPSWRRAGEALADPRRRDLRALLHPRLEGRQPQLSRRALMLAAIYTALFIPFTYMIDRFAYNRWQRRAEQQGEAAAKKR